MIKLFSLITLYFSITLYANNLYSIVIEEPFESALFGVTQDHDGDISTIGFSTINKQTQTSSIKYTNAFDFLKDRAGADGKQLHLIKLDNSGTTTLNLTTVLARFNRGVSVVKTPSNGYFLGGYTLDGELLIIKLSADGKVLLERQFGTKKFDKMNKLVPLKDGGILAVGSSITSRDQHDPMFEQGLGLNDIYITRFSRSGEKLWSKKYGTLDDDRGIDAAEAFDGTILILATASKGKNKTPILMRVSEDGDKIWLKNYIKKGVFNVYGIISLRDGNFLVSATQYDKNHKEQIRLIKFDLQNNILAEQDINTNYNSALNEIREYSNGTIIGVGYSTDTHYVNTDALAIMFSPELHPIWKRQYGGKNRDEFHALTILRNGQVVAVGETTNNASQVRNMWIVKLNNDGSIALKTDNKTTDDSFYKALRTYFQKELTTKQILIEKDLRIKLNSDALLFKVGVSKLTSVQKRFLKEFSKKLMSFMYQHKSQINGFEINGFTSSEWKNTNYSKGYLNNAELSSKRALNVLACFYNSKQKQSHQKWLSTLTSSNANAYAQQIKQKDIEDKKASRRVAFQINLN